jgi:hypothetical protein
MCPSCFIRTKCPGERRVPSGSYGLGFQKPPKTKAGIFSSPAEPKPPGLLRSQLLSVLNPRMLWIKYLPAFHYGKSVKQQFVHAGPYSRHFCQRPLLPLYEPVIMGADARVVQQAGNGGHVEHMPHSSAAPTGHAAHPAPALAGILGWKGWFRQVLSTADRVYTCPRSLCGAISPATRHSLVRRMGP